MSTKNTNNTNLRTTSVSFSTGTSLGLKTRKDTFAKLICTGKNYFEFAYYANVNLVWKCDLQSICMQVKHTLFTYYGRNNIFLGNCAITGRLQKRLLRLPYTY